MRSTVSEILQHGFGDMHMDDRPVKVIRSIVEDEKIMEDAGFEDEAPVVMVKPEVFEVWFVGCL